LVQVRGRRLFYAIFGLVVVAIIVIQVTAFYYFQQVNSDAPRSGCAVFVCTLVNFGNSAPRWYNETSVPAGWNFYNLTLFIAHGNVQSVFDPSLNEHLVMSIDGIATSGQFSWTLWLYCGKQNAWVFSIIGADDIKLTNGEALAWAYENSNSSPISGSMTVSSCS
jgi:hypothetical protein